MTLTEALNILAPIPERKLKKRSQVTKEQQTAVNTILGAYKKIRGIRAYSIAGAYIAVREHLIASKNHRARQYKR